VLNVWKRVDSYARDGFTALIHGKHYHEETRATASQVFKHPGGAYLVVRDMAEARLVTGFIEGAVTREALLARFAPHAVSPGFDPDRHLRRIGVANQTTMLASESLAIAEEVGRAMERAGGPEHRATHFRSFDTICSATQERQDAVEALLDAEPLDLMIVVGGYNSSNTCNLARICAARVQTYHIAEPDCLISATEIRHRPVGPPSTVNAVEAVTRDWLPKGLLRVGLTAGASTPNNIVGQVIETLGRFTSA
jgi:4-hydroxy-3-methylbut-2-enyl diphosphate reductase